MSVLKTKDTHPIIGISTSFLKITEKPFTQHQRIYVNNGYIESIIKAGGIPLLIPMSDNVTTIDELLNLTDALVLSGGHDVDPAHYGEQPHPLLGPIAPQRDKIDMHLIRKAAAAKKPILGICRGMQILNVAFGGSLYQDISVYSQESPSIHSLGAQTNAGSHEIEITPHSVLHKIFGVQRLETNSYHHQAVKMIAPGFSAVAKAKDGLIEGIAKTDDSWTIGVQWHPETMTESHPQMIKLFQALVSEAKKYKGQR